MNPLFSMLILYVGLGLMFLGISVPLIQRRVPPNNWYGFRVPKTLSSPNIWYPVNEHSGKEMYKTGLRVILAAFALAFVPGMKLEFYVAACTTILVLDLFRGLIVTTRYLRTF